MKIKILDIVIIIVAILISTAIILRPIKIGSSKRIELIVDNRIIVIPQTDRAYNFKDDFLDILGSVHNIARNINMEVRSGVVNVQISSCSDKVCVNMPPARECGDMIICLPNKFAVLINCDNKE